MTQPAEVKPNFIMVNPPTRRPDPAAEAFDMLTSKLGDCEITKRIQQRAKEIFGDV